LPVAPHDEAPLSTHTARGSTAFMSTGQQVPPRPGRAHETQPPAHATLQHTPSAQKPDAHSVPILHVAPFIFLPQLPLTHCWPTAHWLDCVHAS
jgi:hypothetical protein